MPFHSVLDCWIVADPRWVAHPRVAATMSSPNDFMGACVSLLSVPRKEAGHADQKLSQTSEVVDYVAAGFGTACAALEAQEEGRSAKFVKFLFDPQTADAKAVDSIHPSYTSAQVWLKSERAATACKMASANVADALGMNSVVIATSFCKSSIRYKGSKGPDQKLAMYALMIDAHAAGFVQFRYNLKGLDKVPRRLFKAFRRCHPELVDPGFPFPNDPSFMMDLMSMVGAMSSTQEERDSKCAACHSKTHATSRCKKCGRVAYCSKKCQIAHWKSEHRDECVDAQYAVEVLNGDTYMAYVNTVRAAVSESRNFTAAWLVHTMCMP